MGRNTQGVRVINLKNNDEIAAIAKVAMDEEVEDENEESDFEGAPTENVDSSNPEFKNAPQTGDNAFSNMGDAEYLKKVEEEEAKENEKFEQDSDESSDE